MHLWNAGYILDIADNSLASGIQNCAVYPVQCCHSILSVRPVCSSSIVSGGVVWAPVEGEIFIDQAGTGVGVIACFFPYQSLLYHRRRQEYKRRKGGEKGRVVVLAGVL